MIKRLILKLLRLLQTRCAHPAAAVKADILEGQMVNWKQVQWCEICGAWRFYYPTALPPDFRHYSEWRTPRPDFYRPEEIREERKCVEV